MCGIVGAVAARNVVPVLLEGLKRLEYRGYDSCGVAVYNDGLKRARSVHRVQDLVAQVDETHFSRHHRHIAYALGHAWRAGHAERASAFLARWHCARA